MPACLTRNRFLKADDDTYVAVDNLREFLSSYSPSDDHYIGMRVLVFHMRGGHAVHRPRMEASQDEPAFICPGRGGLRAESRHAHQACPCPPSACALRCR